MKVSDLLENDFENNDSKERSFWHQFHWIQRKDRSLAHHIIINGQHLDTVIHELINTGHTFDADDPRAYASQDFRTGQHFRVGVAKVGKSSSVRYCLITPETERFVNRIKDLRKNITRLGQEIRKYMIMKEKMKKDPLWNAGREIK